ncbi:hypothetical protein DUNSADRAFT_1828 [Dunaliella salina]|uniref:Encoded protein n=1 Tax=Dunaliella salina TaxID=3046 RepID=A0ABQ7FWY6_DUNSA|nr:hypothetical protein DUNSADRAFT_1828 [Dunaliella salina]|eukprot:KAF5826882.1 hypothetical protein DUNSADRAFT_1828 [Dunaliella salina]
MRTSFRWRSRRSEGEVILALHTNGEIHKMFIAVWSNKGLDIGNPERFNSLEFAQRANAGTSGGDINCTRDWSARVILPRVQI